MSCLCIFATKFCIFGICRTKKCPQIKTCFACHIHEAYTSLCSAYTVSVDVCMCQIFNRHSANRAPNNFSTLKQQFLFNDFLLNCSFFKTKNYIFLNWYNVISMIWFPNASVTVLFLCGFYLSSFLCNRVIFIRFKHMSQMFVVSRFFELSFLLWGFLPFWHQWLLWTMILHWSNSCKYRNDFSTFYLILIARYVKLCQWLEN